MLASIVAGCIIGLERQWRQKLAGMRTMTLVTLGACLFVSLSTLIENDSSPSRLAAQVVSGIGFLAGGVILRDGFSVTGINTAATLWCSAAIGSLIGAGFAPLGLVCAVIITLVNVCLRTMSHRLDQLTGRWTDEDGQEENYFLAVVVKNRSEILVRTKIIELLDRYYLNFQRFSCSDLAGNKVRLFLEIEGTRSGNLAMNKIVIVLSQLSEVIEVQQINEEEESTW